MQEWLDKHLGKILSFIGTVLLLAITLIGWFLNRTISQVDERFELQKEALRQEVSMRESEDKMLDLKIENYVSNKEFREFKGTIQYMQEDVREMKKDIKILLKEVK